MGRLVSIDGSILLWIQENLRVNALTPIVKFITSLGNVGMIWIVITLVMLIMKRTRRVGLMCACSLMLSLLINNVLIKNIVARTRPYEAIQAIRPLVALPIDYSFPSGHSAASFACAWVMLRKLPHKYGIPAAVLAICIALSRLYVGVHYPSDVLAGIVSGIVFSYIAEYIVEKVMPRS